MITLSYGDEKALAGGIAAHWEKWNSARVPQLELWAEVDTYIHATDTSALEGGNVFDHRTHIPVVAELHEDLIAIVYSTMFPHEDWLGFKGFDINAITKTLRRKVLSFIKRCHALNGFHLEMRKVIDDFIRYGNCFVKTHYVNNVITDEDKIVDGYAGPQIKRISPFDIVFNPTSTSFCHTPKIIRELTTVGEFKEWTDSLGDDLKADVTELLHRRSGGMDDYSDRYKEKQYIPQGFGSIDEYYTSGMIEKLWFYGDIYDSDTQEVHKGRCIVVVDGNTVVLDNFEPKDGIRKGGWKNRPDNLWSQGPLDNVVGINFMINHRENAKNEAIDKFIYPDRAYVGDVEEIYDEVTGHTKYIMPENGSVTDIRPDTTVLTYDNQIVMHRQLAREAARLPQQLAGFRTAGEKTATEVQSLNDGAFRGFINKVAQLEEDLLEPVIQDEIRVARDNFSAVIRILEEDEEGIMLTSEITEKDLSANAKLVPHGSRRFARQLQQMAALNQLANTNLYQIIGQHANTYNIARAWEDLAGFDKFETIGKLAAIDEQLEAQEKQMYAEQEMVNTMSEPTAREMELEDFEEDEL